MKRNKIADSVAKGDIDSALIRIDSVLCTEDHILVLDTLIVMLDQLRNKAKQINSYGVTDDLKESANAIVFASDRLDIKNIEKLKNMLKSVMDKGDFLEAMNGSCINRMIQEKIKLQ